MNFSWVVVGMGVKKKVTLSIDTKTYDNYRQYCEEHAILLSKKIELYMKSELDKAQEH